MSSCATAGDHVLMLIEPQAHVRCSAYKPPRQPLAERLVKAYEATHSALIEQCLAGEELGLRLERLSRY
jgi:hypothetical protein